MTKTEALTILSAIHERSTSGITVEQGIQLAVDSYVDKLLNEDSKLTLSTIQSDFDKKANNFAKSFQQALRTKLKTVREKLAPKEPKKVKPEEKIPTTEVARRLKMTLQNLNHKLRTHPEIHVIRDSKRKNYLTELEIEKLRRL